MPEAQREPLTQDQIDELRINCNFDESVSKLLYEVGFEIKTLKSIAKWDPLVNMLNRFVPNYTGGAARQLEKAIAAF